MQMQTNSDQYLIELQQPMQDRFNMPGVYFNPRRGKYRKGDVTRLVRIEFLRTNNLTPRRRLTEKQQDDNARLHRGAWDIPGSFITAERQSIQENRKRRLKMYGKA